jgi:hypothetical protein
VLLPEVEPYEAAGRLALWEAPLDDLDELVELVEP